MLGSLLSGGTSLASAEVDIQGNLVVPCSVYTGHMTK